MMINFILSGKEASTQYKIFQPDLYPGGQVLFTIHVDHPDQLVKLNQCQKQHNDKQ